MQHPNYFRHTILNKLVLALRLNQVYLEQMNEQGFTSGIAWISRNLLELSIWTRYCLVSEENAEVFYKDGARDAMGAMKLPDEMLKADRLGSFKQTRQQMLESAVDDNIENPTDYTPVSDAAKAINYPHFGKINMLLSKWAHPTAISVLMLGRDAQLNATFYKLGARWVDDSIKLIELFLSQAAG